MIERVSKLDRQTYDKPADNCRAHEYPFGLANINAALIKLSGRYPASDWSLNTACESLVYVIRGHGHLLSPQTSLEFKAGDQMYIPRDQPYAFMAEAEILYSATPAWTPQQARVVEA